MSGVNGSDRNRPGRLAQSSAISILMEVIGSDKRFDINKFFQLKVTESPALPSQISLDI